MSHFVSVSSLENQSRDLVNVPVHIIAPCFWGVQKGEKPICRGGSAGSFKGVKVRNRTLNEGGGDGNWNPLAVELEGHLRWKQS